MNLTEIVLDATQPTVNLSLILATLWMINNDFTKSSISALTMGQYATNEESRLYHNDLMNEVILRAMLTPNIKVYIEGELHKEILEEEEEDDEDEFAREYYGREKFIWFLDSLTSYRNFERDLVNPKMRFHRNGYFLLVYTGKEHERLGNIKQIFRRLFALYSINVNVLMVVGKSPYLYTYFPFGKNKCHSSMPEFYLSFRDIQKNFATFEVGKPLFPSKVDNMYGCELTVSTWTYAPYIFVDIDPETGELKRLHGIEGMLLSLLAELMNFKIRIKPPDPPDRGDVYPNGTSTGATKMVIDAEANITIISFMYNKIRSELMQASYSYLYIPYHMALPQGQAMSPFERLMKPFRYIIWSCFSSSILFATFFIYYIRYLGRPKLMSFIYGQGNRIPFTNMLAVVFGVGIFGNFPHKTFARFLLLVFLWYTFVLRTAYSGALYILLQDGRPRNTIKSIAEIVENNFTIYAFPAVEVIIKLSLPESNTGIIDAYNPVPALFKRVTSSSGEKIALCLLDYSIRSYNQRNPHNRVHVLDKSLLSSPIVFYMPKHSYLKSRTNELILEILQAGLIKRFESYYLYSSPQTQSETKEPQKLSLQLLSASFYIYAFFLAISFVIFLIELLSSKSQRCKIIIDFLNI